MSGMKPSADLLRPIIPNRQPTPGLDIDRADLPVKRSSHPSQIQARGFAWL